MNQQLIDDLQATRQTLEQRGRCVISLTRPDGTVCLDGAVGVALIEGFETLDRQSGGAGDPAYDALHRSSRAMGVMSAIADQVGHWPTARHYPDKTVSQMAEGDVVKACWIFNDWCDATDQDCYDAIDKAIVEAGGIA